jgi:3-hydroxyisobutyrate dehydrogenase
MAETIAFIGLGNMGCPMAANLVKGGYRVTGFDLSPPACADAREKGIKTATSAPEAVSDADVVITMLPAGRHVLAVWREIVPAMKDGALLIDSSTIDVGSARQAHEMAAAANRGLASLDAPVSGGVGGEKMGAKIVHCGDAGAGQAAKICNNMILGISMIGVAEAFVLAEKLGLSHQALFDVASTSSGQCWSLTSYCPVPGPVPSSPANNGYKPGFAAALMLKDLRLAQEAANATGATTPLGAEAAQLYSLFAAAGHASEDFSGIINFLRGGGKD